MTRWEERWQRARAAAESHDATGAGVAAVAVDHDRAVVLDVSDDVARLLLLARGADGWDRWAEPVMEPLTYLSHLDAASLKWSVGPVKVTMERRTTWAWAGAFTDPPPRIGARFGPRLVMGAIAGEHFAVVATRVPTAIPEALLCGLPAEATMPLWSFASTPANDLAELS